MPQSLVEIYVHIVFSTGPPRVRCATLGCNVEPRCG